MPRIQTLAIASTLGVSLAALGQTCTPSFQPGEPGATGIGDPFSAYAQPMTFFQGDLIVGGAFSSVGGLATNCIGAFNPSTNAWSRLGGGANLGSTNGFGAALATFTLSGEPHLIFGGSFASMLTSGGATVPNTTSLAAWDGSQWTSLSTNWQPATGRSVWTLLDWQPTPGEHRLLAGGGFPSIGAATAAGVAFFDGEGWNNVGGPTDTGIAGSFSPTVFCSAVYNGDLYIGGRFASVNGVAAPNIARWNGTAWQRPGLLGNGGAVSDVSSLCVFDDGSGAKLYAGGYTLSVSGQAATVARFDGTSWTAVGQNLGGRGTGLAVFDDGTGPKLFMGMTADASQHYIYSLENNTWIVVDGGVSVPISGNFPSVFGLFASPTTLYVGGNFQQAGSQTAHGIAAYAGCRPTCGSADFNGDGNVGTDQDILDFFSCLAGFCCPTCGSADFNGDGDVGTDADIEAFFRVLAGGSC